MSSEVKALFEGFSECFIHLSFSAAEVLWQVLNCIERDAAVSVVEVN
jgi:hypothetical protein